MAQSNPARTAPAALQDCQPQNLARRVRDGDQAAFDDLVKANYSGLCDFAFVFVRDREAAEDIVQDVFVRLWERRAQWFADEPIAYLYRSVRNRAMSVLRRDKLQTAAASQIIAERQLDESTIQQPEQDDLLNAVHRAVDSLPDRCRLIFTMSRQQGLSRGKIAQALDLSVRTVDAQLARAFKLLRQRVGSG